ncbi:MAG TPA: serine protease [Pyrinomonadaceae bacterium]
MKRLIYSFALVVVIVFSLLSSKSAASSPASPILKVDQYAVSLELKFTRKNANPLQRAIAFLDWGPNGYATGFLVGDGLVITANHVVSGDLSASKKVQLGFAAKDQLDVRVSVNGCQATVLGVDEDADLALLRVCQSQKQTDFPAFQASINKDERLFLIARPHGDKMVRRGVFYGLYPFRGQEYLSAKIDVRDGYSGSPVYNDKAELVGVYSGYDWSKKLAVISPVARAQKLLEDYHSKP